MAEYIEREVLLADFGEEPMVWDEYDEEQRQERWDWRRYKRIVESQPAADVVEVRHGRWVGLEYDGYADGCPVYDLWECSECGEEVRGEDVPDTHLYCPNCGCRMDKDGE